MVIILLEPSDAWRPYYSRRTVGAMADVTHQIQERRSWNERAPRATLTESPNGDRAKVGDSWGQRQVLRDNRE